MLVLGGNVLQLRDTERTERLIVRIYLHRNVPVGHCTFDKVASLVRISS